MKALHWTVPGTGILALLTVFLAVFVWAHHAYVSSVVLFAACGVTLASMLYGAHILEKVEGQVQHQQNMMATIEAQAFLAKHLGVSGPSPTVVKRSAEPIIAYRAWRCFDAKNLKGMSDFSNGVVPDFAPRQRMEAKFLDTNPDTAGIHAFKNPGQIAASYPLDDYVVFGRVALWGKVEIHRDGYRAQYGYPQLFFSTSHNAGFVKALAQEWGIEYAPMPAELKDAVTDFLDRKAAEQFLLSWESAISQREAEGYGTVFLDAVALRERDKANIEAWHNQRYRGGGMTVDPRFFLRGRV